MWPFTRHRSTSQQPLSRRPGSSTWKSLRRRRCICGTAPRSRRTLCSSSGAACRSRRGTDRRTPWCWTRAGSASARPRTPLTRADCHPRLSHGSTATQASRTGRLLPTPLAHAGSFARLSHAGRLPLHASHAGRLPLHRYRLASLVKEVREAFAVLLLRKIRDPTMDLASSAIVKALVQVLSSGESARPVG